MDKMIPYAKQLAEWRKRREKVLALHAAGFSMSQIGAKLGVSKTRAHQIVRRHNDKR